MNGPSAASSARCSVAVAIVVLVVGGACRDLDRTTPCFDLVCPVGYACSQAHEICVLDEQLAACEGGADDTPCSFPGVTDGRCFDGTCFAAGCGNGVLEPGEVCDDGDTFDGDGCSADCRSDETCGNGVIDVEVGERCDDENTENGDGCQANCSLPRCGDGIVDPDEACDDENDDAGDGCNPQCTSDETCGNGVIDVIAGEDCDDGGTEVGDGCGAICVIEACGNGIMDPDEVCDDDNTVSGDGCSATCLSLEECGNDIIDPANGEECDDGDLASGDGCSSACTVEFPIWSELDPGVYSARHSAAAVYDSARERIIMFGGRVVDGSTAYASDETWEFDGNSWQQVHTANAPGPRYAHAMAYDAKRQVVVLYGGFVDDETWEYDGTDWTQRSFGFRPDDAAFPTMTYDAAREQIVLVTQDGGLNPDLKTYTYDGLGWTLAATTGPSYRIEPTIAYHAGRQTVFLTGGATFGGPSPPTWVGHTDTWEWNGTSWTELVGSAPTGQGELVYDVERDRLVAFGGFINSGAVSVWDGSWSELNTPNKPAARFDATLVYDPARRVTVLFGGDLSDFDGDAGSFDDTWELADDDWTPAVIGPVNRWRAGGAFDARRGRAVVVGGLPSDLFFDPIPEDTWELVDGAWRKTLSSFPGGPPAGTYLNMVYDPERQMCISVASRPGPGDPTFGYDGATWRDLGATGPDTVGAHATAFDGDRGVLVLIAGGETSELDSTGWTSVTTAGSPPGSAHAVYDSERQKVVLLAATTWEYDATVDPPTWTDTGLSGPPTISVAMAYHQGRVVLFGGGLSTDVSDDTWVYDGAAWTELTTPISPPGHMAPTFIDDTSDKRLLLVGGENAPYITWQLRWVSGSDEEVCDAVGDEDGDGLDDCLDPDCLGRFCGPDGVQCEASALCECPGGAVETSCSDGWDDDCDGDVDCDDTDCAASAYCSAEASCDDETDDDADGVTDCADPGCVGVGFCELFETSCGDDEDNDGDGLVDCEDVNCFLAPCASVEP
jgi:cysteine-rich repeat protein